MFRKIVSVLAVTVVLFTIVAGGVSANDETQFNLVEYIENNEISSRSELVDIIARNTGNADAISDTEQGEYYFHYYVDYAKQTVEVDTIYLSERTSYVTTGQATHDTYSALGKLIFTVSVTGSFTRTSDVVVTNSASGSFTPGVGSTWSCPSPAISSGNQSRNIAYARIAGTATSMLQSSTFQLTLTCDTSGALHATYTES